MSEKFRISIKSKNNYKNNNESNENENNTSQLINSLKKHIEKENLNHSFKIKGGSIKLNPLFGFADGKYNLHKYSIKEIEKNYYNLKINFRLKKGKYGVIPHDENMQVFHKGNVLAIQHNKKVYKFRINRHNQVINIGDMTLHLEFNRKIRNHRHNENFINN